MDPKHQQAPNQPLTLRFGKPAIQETFSITPNLSHESDIRDAIITSLKISRTIYFKLFRNKHVTPLTADRLSLGEGVLIPFTHDKRSLVVVLSSVEGYLFGIEDIIVPVASVESVDDIIRRTIPHVQSMEVYDLMAEDVKHLDMHLTLGEDLVRLIEKVIFPMTFA